MHDCFQNQNKVNQFLFMTENCISPLLSLLKKLFISFSKVLYKGLLLACFNNHTLCNFTFQP